MKNKTILIASYAEGFQCIGGKCEDSCCIGWDIDVDRTTYRQYRKVKDPELKTVIRNHVYRNRGSYSKEVDYGRIAIEESGWCPFLNEEKLCDIQNVLGEDCLSNVCYSFPRAYNIMDGVYELTLYMSCPEAVRNLLAKRDPIRFIEREMIPVKYIVNSSFNSGDRSWRNSPIRKLPELRTLSIEMIQDRTISLRDRILNLGFRLEELSLEEGASHRSNRLNVKEYERTGFTIEFFSYLVESLGILGETDSPVFSRHTGIVLDMFSGYGGGLSESMSLLFERTIETVIEPFEKEYFYLFEHYLVNAIYQENFPFGDSDDPFDAYLFLIVRYAFIRYYLTGIAGEYGRVEIDDVASMIQSHSKIINHHKSFKYNVLQEMKRKNYDNMDFVSLLIP